ncbi:MAG: dihydroorotase [Robiginitomaculum sp.]|nr:dihydroorotase [Robiginitomaculum sp.]
MSFHTNTGSVILESAHKRVQIAGERVLSKNPFATIKQKVNLSPEVADEVKTTTCYMCACRCGIKVHLKEGKVRYIEGNPDHPINKGVLCAKGSAGIMTQYSPAKLTKPLLRVGERGEGKFKEIEWDEALALAEKWLGDAKAKDPSRLAFFTGRDQSQSLTGWWAKQFGTRNFAAHGGFCSVNMAAGGIYTVGGAFWEFGEPDWDLTKYFMMFGVAEDHDSNPIKIGLGKLKTRGDAKFVAVNPSRNGYNSIADEWIGIRPGTDGLFIFALIHELLKAEKVDFKYLARYSNAPWLIIQNPGGEDDGLVLRDKKGNPLCYDLKKKKPVSAMDADITPALVGARTVRKKQVVPAFELLAKRFLNDKYAPDAVAETTGVPADTIRRIAAELAQVAFEEEIVIDQPWTDVWGRKHDKMIGRPVSFHAMRGISAHSNGFHTCRAIHILQVLLGSVDVPGGWRNKAPYPKPIPPGPKPSGEPIGPNMTLEGMPLGTPTGPEDLLVDDDGGVEAILSAINRRAAFHSEDEARLIAREGERIEGDPSSHPVWRDAEAARLCTERLIRIARKTGKRIHVLHISTAEEIPLLAANKDVATVELTPQHLTLAAPEAYESLGTYAQMNPPIRSAEHRAGLWRGLADGVVDVLGSDHAPHTIEEKEQPYPLSPSGMPGVQTLVPIMLTHVNNGNLSLERFVDLTSHGPCRIFGISQKGRIAAGYDADFTIVDMSASRTITNDWIESRCGWTPYDGSEVKGWPIGTIIRGNTVMWDDEIIGNAAGQPVGFLETLQKSI